MSVHVSIFLLVIGLFFSLARLGRLCWFDLRPSSSQGGVQRTTLHRLLKPLCWLLGPSVLEKRHTRRKQPGALKTNWPIVSACHAVCLADHPTPVGFA